MSSVDLPDPDGPTSPDSLAGLDREAHALQDVHPGRSPAKAEVDPVELDDLARHAAQSNLV